jgi:hypothetical protein
MVQSTKIYVTLLLLRQQATLQHPPLHIAITIILCEHPGQQAADAVALQQLSA